MKPIKVTVTMPVYNGEKYLRDAIESVLSQSFREFELLIGDDGSTDGTPAILRKYRKHPLIRVFRFRRRADCGIIRNLLTKEARGKYLSPCDADDIMLPENLARLTRHLDRNPKVGMVFGDLLVLELGRGDRLIESPYLMGRDPQKTWDLFQNNVNHAGSLIRKSLFVKAGGYDENAPGCEDRSLWLRLGELTKIEYLKGEVLYVYRRHPKSKTRAFGTTKSAARVREQIVLKAIERRYRGNP